MNKKFLVVLGLFTLVVIVTGIILTPKNQNTPPPVNTGPTQSAPREILPLPTPILKNNQPQVSFVFSAGTKPAPNTLPVYSTTPLNITQQQNAIAKNLGFSGAPTTPPAPPNALFWNNAEGYVTISSAPPTVSFYRNSAQTGAPSQKDAAGAATAFVSKIGITSGAFTLSPGSVSYNKISGSSYLPAASASSADMAAMSLIYNLNNLPLYNASGLPFNCTFQIYDGGVVKSAFVQFPPVLGTSQQKEIIPAKQAAQLLAENKGSLASIVSSTPSESSITNISFSAVNVTNYDLGYMYDAVQKTIFPVYVFRGTVIQGAAESAGATVFYFTPATYK